MNIVRFHHAAIICADYERSQRFHTGALGLAVIGDTTGKPYTCFAEPDGLPIALYGK